MFKVCHHEIQYVAKFVSKVGDLRLVSEMRSGRRKSGKFTTKKIIKLSYMSSPLFTGANENKIKQPKNK